MGEQYGWSDSAKGAISSSFFAGYTITNLIGRFSDPCPAQHAQHGSMLQVYSLLNVKLAIPAELH